MIIIIIIIIVSLLSIKSNKACCGSTLKLFENYGSVKCDFFTYIPYYIYIVIMGMKLLFLYGLNQGAVSLSGLTPWEQLTLSSETRSPFFLKGRLRQQNQFSYVWWQHYEGALLWSPYLNLRESMPSMLGKERKSSGFTEQHSSSLCNLKMKRIEYQIFCGCCRIG